jgi:hypothetical protein
LGAAQLVVFVASIVSERLLAVPVVLVLYKRGPTPFMVLGLPYAPFELILAVWLIVEG